MDAIYNVNGECRPSGTKDSGSIDLISRASVQKISNIEEMIQQKKLKMV
jgi:hypothetical protein